MNDNSDNSQIVDALNHPISAMDKARVRIRELETALAAERERCATIARLHSKQGATHDAIAAAIRKG
ncbi:hypothetical protein [Bosea sp. Leaf344]|uniref:hypothetical protein n=1 Tax=Bosea sp. Leaf344 TaxID=1736346 RepID=UPI0012E33A3F|nr:hypothetical protein [Bosea sp. Leaf344]